MLCFACNYLYLSNNFKQLLCHVTPYPSDPASEDCLASHSGSSSLVSVLEAKCDEAACSSLRACLLDPAGDLNTAHVSLNTQNIPRRPLLLHLRPGRGPGGPGGGAARAAGLGGEAEGGGRHQLLDDAAHLPQVTETRAGGGSPGTWHLTPDT